MAVIVFASEGNAAFPQQGVVALFKAFNIFATTASSAAVVICLKLALVSKLNIFFNGL